MKDAASPDVDRPQSAPYIGRQQSETGREHMPWDNNTGGGGRNNNSGGPWGQAPQGGGGGPKRGGTPSLEDILKTGRDRFQGGLPGGTRWIVAGGVAVLAVFW